MTSLDQRLAELAGRFAARAPEERAMLARAMAEGDMTTLVERAHKLAGIAGMFAQPEIGEAALLVEAAALDGADWETPGDELLRLLEALGA